MCENSKNKIKYDRIQENKSNDRREIIKYNKMVT